MLGILILLPTLLGVIFAILMGFSTITGGMAVIPVPGDDYAAAAFTDGTVLDLMYPLIVGIGSLAVGACGWFYIIKKNVYRCIHCSTELPEE
jgi:hypothetical protein